MSKKRTEWPTHGHAKNALYGSAERVAEIRKIADLLMDKRHSNRLSDAELIYSLALISRQASDVLRLLEEQGAPTRPYEGQ